MVEKIISNKLSNNFTLFLIIFIALAYGFIIGQGYYGFSNDYYAEYYKNNLIYDSYREYGSFLSTLTIYDVNIGVYLTSFFLAFSTGLLLRSFYYLNNSKSLIYFLIFIIALHVHPIVMSTSGAMRQGWAMVCIFFAISSIIQHQQAKFIFFLFLAIFLHKSGLYFFFIGILYFVYTKLRIENNLFYLIYGGIVIFVFSTTLLLIFVYTGEGTRIIMGDFRMAWLIINVSCIIFCLFTTGLKLPQIVINLKLFLYLFSCSSPSFFLVGLNYQYERINMMMGIPIILIISSFFEKKSFHIIVLISFILYLLLTIYQGMYTVGLK